MTTLLHYKTTTHATRDGSATIGTAYKWDVLAARYYMIGETRTYRTYPQGVRARSHAKTICLRHARQLGVKPRHVVISEQ